MKRLSKNLMSTFSTNEIQLDPGICTRTSRVQLLYGVWVNMTHVAIGLGLGFASVQVPQLSSPDSEIPITRSDASWVASVLLLFCPIGCIISGIVMDRSGRRIMLIFSQVSMFIGWLYTSLAKTPKQIIIARAITGVGCGMAMNPPRIYCTEISLPNLRGVIGSFPNMAVSMGITVQAVLDKFFHWKILCYVCCIFTFVNFCSFTFLPETPYFILQTKSVENARTNLAKFRGPNYNIDREMNQLIDFKDNNNIRKLSFIENMGALFNTASCKPFWLIIIYIFIGQVAGNSSILFWSIELLTEAKSSFDVHTGNIMLALTRVIMGIINSILLYRVGRRPLALISAIGVALACFTLGVFLIYHDEPSVLPLICFILYNVFASLGYYPLPHLMAFELLPLQVRGILGGALVSVHCLMMFSITKVEPFMMDFLGVDYLFVLFGGFSLIGVVFLYFYLPETRDLTLQEIEEYYKEIRPTLVSQRRVMSMSRLSMQSIPKATSSLLKLKRDAPTSMTSKRYELAKLEAQRQLSRLSEQEENRKELENTKSTKSSGSRKSTDRRQSTESRRSHVIFDEKEDDDKYVKSIESIESKEPKEPKESNNDGEEALKDKDQASTSKEYIQ